MFSREKICACDFGLEFRDSFNSVRNHQNALNVSSLFYFSSPWFLVMLHLNLFYQVKME